MSTILRLTGSVVLIMMAAVCVFLAIAARETPPDAGWGFWYVYGGISFACMMGVYWMLWPLLPGPRWPITVDRSHSGQIGK